MAVIVGFGWRYKVGREPIVSPIIKPGELHRLAREQYTDRMEQVIAAMLALPAGQCVAAAGSAWRLIAAAAAECNLRQPGSYSISEARHEVRRR